MSWNPIYHYGDSNKLKSKNLTVKDIYWREEDPLKTPEYLEKEYQEALSEYKLAEAEFLRVQMEYNKKSLILQQKNDATTKMINSTTTDKDPTVEEIELKDKLTDIEKKIKDYQSKYDLLAKRRAPTNLNFLYSERGNLKGGIRKCQSEIEQYENRTNSSKERMAQITVDDKTAQANKLENKFTKLSKKNKYLKSLVKNTKNTYDVTQGVSAGQSSYAKQLRNDYQKVLDQQSIIRKLEEKVQRRPIKHQDQINGLFEQIEELNERMVELGLEDETVDVRSLRKNYEKNKYVIKPYTKQTSNETKKEINKKQTNKVITKKDPNQKTPNYVVPKVVKASLAPTELRKMIEHNLIDLDSPPETRQKKPTKTYTKKSSPKRKSIQKKKESSLDQQNQDKLLSTIDDSDSSDFQVESRTKSKLSDKNVKKKKSKSSDPLMNLSNNTANILIGSTKSDKPKGTKNSTAKSSAKNESIKDDKSKIQTEKKKEIIQKEKEISPEPEKLTENSDSKEKTLDTKEFNFDKADSSSDTDYEAINNEAGTHPPSGNSTQNGISSAIKNVLDVISVDKKDDDFIEDETDQTEKKKNENQSSDKESQNESDQENQILSNDDSVGPQKNEITVDMESGDKTNEINDVNEKQLSDTELIDNEDNKSDDSIGNSDDDTNKVNPIEMVKSIINGGITKPDDEDSKPENNNDKINNSNENQSSDKESIQNSNEGGFKDNDFIEDGTEKHEENPTENTTNDLDDNKTNESSDKESSNESDPDKQISSNENPANPIDLIKGIINGGRTTKSDEEEVQSKDINDEINNPNESIQDVKEEESKDNDTIDDDTENDEKKSDDLDDKQESSDKESNKESDTEKQISSNENPANPIELIKGIINGGSVKKSEGNDNNDENENKSSIQESLNNINEREAKDDDSLEDETEKNVDDNDSSNKESNNIKGDKDEDFIENDSKDNEDETNQIKETSKPQSSVDENEDEKHENDSDESDSNNKEDHFDDSDNKEKESKTPFLQELIGNVVSSFENKEATITNPPNSEQIIEESDPSHNEAKDTKNSDSDNTHDSENDPQIQEKEISQDENPKQDNEIEQKSSDETPQNKIPTSIIGNVLDAINGNKEHTEKTIEAEVTHKDIKSDDANKSDNDDSFQSDHIASDKKSDENEPSTKDNIETPIENEEKSSNEKADQTSDTETKDTKESDSDLSDNDKSASNTPQGPDNKSDHDSLDDSFSSDLSDEPNDDKQPGDQSKIDMEIPKPQSMDQNGNTDEKQNNLNSLFGSMINNLVDNSEQPNEDKKQNGTDINENGTEKNQKNEQDETPNEEEDKNPTLIEDFNKSYESSEAKEKSEAVEDFNYSSSARKPESKATENNETQNDSSTQS